MDQSQLKSFEALCVQEEAPACQTWCPLRVEAREFAALMAAGRFSEARKRLERTMPLSGLVGLLCSGPCVEKCRRAEIEQGVNLPMLERACVLASEPGRPFPLPATRKNVAVVGAGLSGLAAAFELGRKGHAVTLYQAAGSDTASLGELGRAAEELPAALLKTALAEAWEQLRAVRVEEASLPASLKREWLDELLADNLAIYLSLEDPAVGGADFRLPGEGEAANFLTLESGLDKIFAGGGAERFPTAVDKAAAGKRAAASIDRLLQGASPSIMREKDLPYPSRLYTNLARYEKKTARPPSDMAAPTLDEAKTEAGRCIRCECLECVRHCPYMREFKSYPKKIAREVYNNLAVVQGSRKTLLINSCAECGVCGGICPQGADLGAFCAAARRELAGKKAMPPSAHEFALEDMEDSFSPGVAFWRHQPGRAKSAYLFFPGCQLPASLPDEAEKVYRHLCEYLGEHAGDRQGSRGGVGLWFSCCGAPLGWSGREAPLRGLLERLRASWQEAGQPTLILACASCSLFFARELPEIPCRSLWEVLDELPLPPEAKVSGLELALHDPCSSRLFQADLGRAWAARPPALSAMQRAFRSMLEKLEQPAEDLAFGEDGQKPPQCCGYGGLIYNANPALADEFARVRAAGTEKTLLAYCAMCRDRLRQTGRRSLHGLSLFFPPPGGQADQRAAARPAPGFSDRREARRRWRRALLKKYWPETLAEQEDAMPAPTLVISEEVAEKLEKRHILRSDLQNVLNHPESAQFFNKATGRRLACRRPRKVTYWVEYSARADGAYEIHDAYCHRMRVPGVPRPEKPDFNAAHYPVHSGDSEGGPQAACREGEERPC